MRALFVSIMLLCAISAAHADGGRLQVREPAGPFIVSLFTTPDALAIGPADISVMVEELSGGRVLPHANVVVMVSAVDDRGAIPLTARLSHVHATNRLLQDAVIDLPHAGRWRVVLLVSEGGRRAELSTELMVANHSSRRGTVWLFALLPLLAIGLFAWIQTEKRWRRGRVLRAA